jgi:hypothetical protein
VSLRVDESVVTAAEFPEGFDAAAILGMKPRAAESAELLIHTPIPSRKPVRIDLNVPNTSPYALFAGDTIQIAAMPPILRRATVRQRHGTEGYCAIIPPTICVSAFSFALTRRECRCYGQGARVGSVVLVGQVAPRGLRPVSTGSARGSR